MSTYEVKGTRQMEKKAKGLSSSTLKIIAVIAMMFDHFGADIYQHLPNFSIEYYYDIRMVGRMAFPIYCFLLVEGFCLTSNIRKYIGRIFLFALISEIPFDMSFKTVFFDWSYQNVFFTLGLGLSSLYIMSIVDKRVSDVILGWFIKLVIVGIFCGVAQVSKVDYGYMGILFIVFFYFMKISNASPLVKYILGCGVYFYAECIKLTDAFFKNGYWGPGVISIVVFPITFGLINFYNGQRGMKLKYFFYFVYPVHLLIYGIIRMFVLG